jgi:ATP-binding cassette, subfamily G (WHITE), member 2, PDR
MSFVGVNSFGNYDHTAQTMGAPVTQQMSRDDATHEPVPAAVPAGGEKPNAQEEKSTLAASNDVTQTRATSVTETGFDTPRRKETTPGPETETEGEIDAINEDELAEQRREGAVRALARQYTAQSAASGVTPGQNVFLASAADKSPLNPASSNFSARAWAKAVADMVSTEGQQFRTTGVCFQNLNVYGFGVATDYQKDVANVWLDVIGLARRLFGQTKRRIDILRNFDGVVRKGEMLVVLGPPGAGCSTLLKTIAGETSGIYVDDKSYFNYQGTPLAFLFVRFRTRRIGREEWAGTNPNDPFSKFPRRSPTPMRARRNFPPPCSM